MKVRLCIMSARQHLFDEAVGHAVRNATRPIDLVAYGHGHDLAIEPGRFASVAYEYAPENKGISHGLHQLYEIGGGPRLTTCSA